VDFIVYGKEGFWAIEVKHGTNVRGKDLTALKAFLKDYPQAQGRLVYRGTERLSIENILCLPVEEFLLGLVPNRPLP
jgi:hypothetical protein